MSFQLAQAPLIGFWFCLAASSHPERSLKKKNKSQRYSEQTSPTPRLARLDEEVDRTKKM
jgi:hypothetical protein